MSLQRPSTAVRTGQYIALLGYVVFLGFPLVWLMSTALKSTSEIALGSIRLIPDTPTLDNFSAAIAKANLWQAGFNSLVVAIGTTVLTVVIALPAAYGLARYRTILRPITLGWVLVSQMFPTILVIIPLFMILKRLQLLDQLPGLVVVYVVYVLPFCLWMLFGFVQTIPADIEEAAAIDGAGRIRTLVSIVFPLLRPGIVATALFAFISSWNEFLISSQLSSDATQPVTVAIASFTGSQPHQEPYTAVMAAGTIVTIPIIILVLIFQRRIVAGLTAGGVKG